MQMVSRLNLNHVPFVSVDHMMRLVLDDRRRDGS